MAIKTVLYKGQKAILFRDGTVGFSDQLFPQGLGCNLEILKALGLR